MEYYDKFAIVVVIVFVYSVDRIDIDTANWARAPVYPPTGVSDLPFIDI